MSGRRSIRPSVVLGLALGGVLVGHTLAYRLLLPDAHARAIELARSGHGYLTWINAVGLVAVIVSLAALFLGRLLRSEAADTSSIVVHLAGFQVAAFAAMEILERVSSGSGSNHLLPVLAVGLPMQIVVAASIAALARLLLRAADRVAAFASRAIVWPRPEIARLAPRDAAPSGRPITGSPPGRAPPSVPVPA